ncbi:MAG TPA: alpha/beta hydrolase [Solirubrobacteraceae bacterium]|nr:alpha/beta hydrolase [Solirubrobacteraceae bacterium]
MPDELRALTRLTFEELRLATGGIGQIHRAIADRAFGAAGGGTPRAVHDAISGAVYGGLRAGARLAGHGLAPLVSGTISDSPRGAAVLAVLNGLRGDALEREGSELASPMEFRVGGRSVAPADLAVSARVVVFVHGLFETEHAWGRDSYGARLERDLGVTALYVRFNTGRHISENGRSLAALLDELVAAHEITRIALVGHSLGGLVARSACATGGAWTARVRHTVSLGTPHTGAPLESAVHYASAALGAVPETRPFAGFLRRRSAGIRDLRSGSLVDEDWRGRDPEALRAAACAEVPLLEGAAHHFVAATVTRSASHPVGRLVGDWLVLRPSASGRSGVRVIGFRAEDGIHLGGTHHLALLNHPQVYEHLRDWLARSPRAG